MLQLILRTNNKLNSNIEWNGIDFTILKLCMKYKTMYNNLEKETKGCILNKYSVKCFCTLICHKAGEQ